MTTPRELIETLFAAFNRGDIATIVAHVSDDCNLRGTLAPELPYSGNYLGPAGAAKYFEGIAKALTPTLLAVDQYVCEGEHVVAIGRWTGKGNATGKTFDTPMALYFRVRGGKMVEFRGHEDSAVTLAAVKG